MYMVVLSFCLDHNDHITITMTTKRIPYLLEFIFASKVEMKLVLLQPWSFVVQRRKIWVREKRRAWWRLWKCPSFTVLCSSYPGLLTPLWQHGKIRKGFKKKILEFSISSVADPPPPNLCNKYFFLFHIWVLKSVLMWRNFFSFFSRVPTPDSRGTCRGT